MSFVRKAKDIKKIRDVFIKMEYSIPVIAKIEKPEAIKNLNEIVKTFD